MATNCMIEFQCVQQELQRTDKNIVAADAAGTVGAHFELCSKWDGLTVYARFQHMAAVYDVELDEGKCAVIPWEVLKETGFYVSLFGEEPSGARLTSARVFIDVVASIGIDGADPIPPTKTLLQQFIEDADAARAIAQSVRDDADAGKFKGEKGDKGDSASMPEGGTAGQVLRKTADNTATEWGDANDHEHAAEDITSGTLTAERLPTVPIHKGGTGATSSKGATYNLLNGCTMEELTETTPEGNVKLYMRPYSSESSNGGIFAATLGSLWTWVAAKIRTVFGFSSSDVLTVHSGGTGAMTPADAAYNLQVESIGGRTALALGADLNSATTIGSYVCETDGKAESLTNCPVSVAFALTVKSKDGDTSSVALTQEISTADDGNRFYRSTDSLGSWGAWTNDAIMEATSVALLVSDWADNEQTVSVAGVKATNNIIVSPDPDDYKNWGDAGIYAYSQADGSVTFKCRAVPAADVAANVLILS